MRPARKFKRPATRFKKLASGLAIMLAGLVAAALILPGYIDWNRFKSEIEAQASTVTGRGVTINGPIGFRLLPRPELSLEQVTIANDAGAIAPALLSLERLEAHLSVVPLFSGKFQVANFRIIAPVLSLETSPEGAHNWTWRGAAMQPENAGVRFDRVVIERGVLQYNNRKAGFDAQLADMHVQLKADTLRGPFEAAGAVMLQGVPVTLTTRIGSVQSGRSTRLEVKTILDGDAAVNFSGELSSDGDISGELNSQGTDLTGLTTVLARIGVPLFSVAPKGLLRLPYRMESDLAVVRGRITAENARLILNENILTGRFIWDTSEAHNFDIGIAASSLDLDAAPMANQPGATAFAALMPSFSQFEIPPHLNGVARINAKAVKLSGGHVRDVNLALSVAGGTAAIENISAELPGSTTVKFSGKVRAIEGQPQFTGAFEAHTQYLRGLLGWLGVAAPNIPDRSLSQAGITGLLELSPQQANIGEIVAEIDSSKITGSLSMALRERLALGILLHVDQLNLDNYLSVENAPPTSVMQAGGGASWEWARSLAARYDSNFKLSIDNLVYRGMPISDLNADGALIGRALAINRFSVANLAGSAISLSGIFSNITTRPEGEVNLRLASNDLTGLARAVEIALPLPGTQLGKTQIDAKLLLANDALEAVIDSYFGGTNLKLNGAINGFAPGLVAPLGIKPEIKASLSIVNPSLKKFAAQSGMITDPMPTQDEAGINLSAEIAGTYDETRLISLSGAIGAVPVQGAALWRRTGDRPMLQAEIGAGDIFLENFLESEKAVSGGTAAKNQPAPWSGAPINFTLLDQFDADIKLTATRFAARGYDIIRPSLHIGMDQGKAELKLLTGDLFGGEARANARLRRGEASPEFDASWTLRGVDLEAASAVLLGSPALTGKLDFSGAIKGAGASSFAIVSSLEGNALLSASNGYILGVDLPAFATRLTELQRAADFTGAVEDVLLAGKTQYQRINAPFTVSQGVAQSTQAEIGIDSVTTGLTASMDFPRYWINAEASLTMNAHMSAPPLGIAYIGPLNNPEVLARTDRLENFFTQSLLSKSLQRVINNRDTVPGAAAPVVAAPVPVPAPAAPAPPPQAEKDNAAQKILNGILNGINRGKNQ